MSDVGAYYEQRAAHAVTRLTQRLGLLHQIRKAGLVILRSPVPRHHIPYPLRHRID